MKWIKRFAVAVAVLLAVAAAVPFLIPLDTYIPQIEKQGAEKIGEPVKIGGLKLAFLPSPHVTLEQIAIGKDRGLTVRSIKITPEPSSLLDAVKVIKEIEIDEPALNQDLLARLSALSKGGGGAAAVRVERIELRGAKLTLKKKGTLPPFDAKAILDPGGTLQNAELATSDGKMKVWLKPAQAQAFALDLVANGWTLPVGPPVAFEKLKAVGKVDSRGLKLAEIEGRLYGGSLKADASLDWHSGWRFSGHGITRGVELKSLVPLINPDVKVSGRLDSQANFSSRAADAKRLGDMLQADGHFSVKDGVLYNVDIVEAAKAPLKGKTVKGGQTRFDDLSGNFRVTPAGYRLSNLKISSGVLAASGDLSISKKKEIAGKINAEVKTGISLVSVPLVVSGTLEDPSLRPTGAAVAGAAAGTAILGPGVGTSLGVKAGNFFDRLFGGSSKQDKK